MTPRCEIDLAGTIALYHYGELGAAERSRVERHLKGCTACRQALDDLATISAALATVERVSSPPGGDWSSFMSALDASLRADPPMASAGRAYAPGRRDHRLGWTVAGLGLAAALVLVTMGILWSLGGAPQEPGAAVLAETAPAAAAPGTSPADPVLAAVSGQHFARSKVVVLGLATRDATVEHEQDWSVERDLASTLLNDTRLYRIAAEDRGMTRLAGVMRDLELVLLEASMTPEAGRERLEQVQRLIRRRDLVTKMNAASGNEFD